MQLRFLVINVNQKIKEVLKVIMILLLIPVLMTAPILSAQSTDSFNAGRIIDDYTFFNSNSMSTLEIQNFLNSKVPVCETNHPQGSYPYPPPYICLKDYSTNTDSIPADSFCSAVGGGVKSAATIIKEVASACSINPQVLLVLLQKEQILITDTWPLPSQYTKATGFGCPDSDLGSDLDTNNNNCYDIYEGFFKQVYYGARQYQRYAKQPNLYNFRANQTFNIQFNPNSACGSSPVFIQNQATAGLYNYTPYQPNQAALNNLYGTGNSCSAYGNRNFWRMFRDWFGTTYAFIVNGVSYSPVFDPEYYLTNNPDLRSAYGTSYNLAFSHFVNNGMKEGRQASASFNVTSYKNRYVDLRRIFGNDLTRYFWHFSSHGKNEGRIATGDVFVAETFLNGVNYDKVYNFQYYLDNNPDIKSIFTGNDSGALVHFVRFGMNEGRQAIGNFNVNSYRSRYFDLRRAFGSNLPLYYRHYIDNGNVEGRIATGTELGGVTTFNKINYGVVYSFDYYMNNNPDLKLQFGLDDERSIHHFVTYGMSEGRHAIGNFNVIQYKNKYLDLQAVYGSNLPSYYVHYINYGMKEGRTSTP